MAFSILRPYLRHIALGLSAIVPTVTVAVADVHRFDVVIYGGTAAGVMAGVAAYREGAQVAIVEPGEHLGGMAAAGLGWTDFGTKSCIGGLSRGFFQRLGKRYDDSIRWTFEPHEAESVFNELARESQIKIFWKTRLKEAGAVRKQGARIADFTAENGDVFEAKVFLDATYEGDLMAQAGVSYATGREGTAEYGESLAGVRPYTSKHQFTNKVSGRTAGGALLPEIMAGPKGTAGAGDKKIQAYNFRLCMTDKAGAFTPFTRPAGYDSARYALLGRHVQALTAAKGETMGLDGNLMKLSIVHGATRKTDTNNEGGFSTDYIGGSWDYPDASYARRAEIWKAHEDYLRGFFWYLQSDPAVPAPVRDKMAKWGLAKDEFTATGNWPHQLYVRESRRMVGEYVMVQKDIQTDRTKAEGVGMGSYNSDSHHVQRVLDADGNAENEGDMQVAVQPYEIPYRILTPKRAQATNLLVPVCFSASHVTYSTLRMEPQYMILGQAAGIAAHMAISQGVAVQEIDVQRLRSRLKAVNAELGTTPVSTVAGLLPVSEGRLARRLWTGSGFAWVAGSAGVVGSAGSGAAGASADAMGRFRLDLRPAQLSAP